MVLTLPRWSAMYAHVKWFIDDFSWTPQPMSKVLTNGFLYWFGLTIAGLLLCSVLAGPLERVPIVRSLHGFLNRFVPYKMGILRVGLGIGLVLQLLTGTYLAPEFPLDAWWQYVLMITAIAGLVHKKLLTVSGAALAFLYIRTITVYGLFHSLDYMFYVGIIYCLVTANTKWNRTGTHVMYVFTGLSLAWLAMEKLTLAKLACTVMHDYGLPTMGFTVEDFVLISAFVELGLAWAFIVGLMNRFTALLVTGIFLFTASVFGETEVVGHTILHTLFLLFIIEGSGTWQTLFNFHRSLAMRCLFVAVNFCFLLFALMAIYIWMGQPGNIFSA
ncbi:hypothetical protein [Paenibacillus xanthanilyticus]|uniref:DoxX family membrane protein n=1 Tax=Paenibacillus xanthanilyticus TaxID=1783531 RepID=A0ABV8K5E7_9BACL